MYWYLVIAIVALVIGYLLAPKPGQGLQPGQIQAPTAEEGRAIPVLFGTRLIKGPNLVWWGDASGAKAGDHYVYYVGMHMVICKGPIDWIRNIYVADRVLDIRTVDYPFTKVTLITSGGLYNIKSDTLFGGTSHEGGVEGYFDFLGGEDTQTQNSYLAALQASSDYVPSYRGVASVVIRHTYVGTTPYLKDWSFYAQRIHVRQNGIAQWYEAKCQIGVLKAEPLALHFALDYSGSMNDMTANGHTRFYNMRTAVHNVLDFLNSLLDGSSTLQLDISIQGFGTLSPSQYDYIYRRNCTASDIVDLKTFIPSSAPVYFTYFPYGVSQAPSFFSGAPSNANKIIFFLTDGYPTSSGTSLPPEDIANAAAAIVDAIPNCITYGINIDESDTTYTDIVDNSGGVLVLDGSNPDALTNYIIQAFSGHVDMNPAHIIRECLTDPVWGMGYAETDIDDVSFTAAADLLFSEAVGISLLWDTEASIEDFISLVCKHINASIYVDRHTGKFVLRLIRKDYIEDGLLALNPSNVSSVSDYQRMQFGELTNAITVSYWNWETKDTSTLTVQDIAGIAMQGVQISTSVEYKGFTNSNVAARIAERDLKALSSALISCTVYANTNAATLNIGDVFKLTWPDYELDGVVMRVTSIAYGDGKSNRVRLSCVQDAFAMPSYAFIAPTPPEGLPADSTPLPIPVSHAYEVPYIVAVRLSSQTAVDTYLTTNPATGNVGISGSRPQDNAIEAEVWVNDGAGYEKRTTSDFCATAALYTDISLTASSIIITDLKDGTAIDALTVGSFFQIDNEILSIVSINSIGGFPELRTLFFNRGVLDTLPAVHSTSAKVVFWDSKAIWDDTQYLSGDVVNLKMLTATGSGVLPLVDGTERTVTILGRAARPYPPGDFRINSTGLPGSGYYPATINGLEEVLIQWSYRNRKAQMVAPYQHFLSADVGPEVGVTHNLRIYSENSVLLRSENVNANSWTYTNALELSDVGVGGGDPYWINTISMLHLNNTSWIDETGLRTWTPTSSPTISTTIFKLGGASGFFNNSPHLLAAASNDWMFGTGDFTVEAWCYPTVTPGGTFAAAMGNWASDNGWCFFYRSGNTFYWRGPGFVGTQTPAAALNTWHHFAYSRQAGVGRTFLNGVLSSTQTDTTDYAYNGAMRIGRNRTTDYWRGYIDEVRITNGIARYASSFTPDIVEFPNTQATGRLNGRLRLELESVRSGIVSYQKYDHTIERTGYGFNYGTRYGS